MCSCSRSVPSSICRRLLLTARVTRSSTVYAVVNFEGTHEIPRIAEPLWLALKANVEFIPAMAQDDFAKAAPLIEQAAKKYR